MGAMMASKMFMATLLERFRVAEGGNIVTFRSNIRSIKENLIFGPIEF